MNYILRLALKDDKFKVVEMLLRLGADPNARYGKSPYLPLEVAAKQLSQVCDIVPFREQVKFDPDLPLRIFCALLDAGAVVDADCLHNIVRTMGCLPFLKELVLRGVDITLSPCALNSLRPSSSPEVYRETLDIFASAYGTLSSLRTALLTDPQRVRHNILLSYGLDADRPVSQSHLEHLGRTLVSKLLPGDIETSIESACNGFLHDDTFRLLCKNVEKAITTPKQLELFQGTLRALDHAGYLNPEVMTEQLFHLVESRNSEDFELEGVLEGLLDMGAGMYLFNPRYNILYPCQENFSDVLALAAIHGKERILSFLLQKLPWPPASASRHPAWPSWFQQEEFDSLRLVYRNNVDTTLACLASSKPLFTPRLADCGCPLLVAVDRGDVHAVKTLIALGVDVNKKGQSGWTPLHAAARGDHAAIAEVLLQANASVNALAYVPWRTQDRLGPADSWTPLHAAALRGNLQVIKKLLEYGVDIHIAECCTGAERGAWAPRRALDVVLLSGAVDADHTEDYGKRLLHPDRLTAALLLIERGASISGRVAVDWKSFELDEILEYFGEHPSLWDKFVAEDWEDVDERELRVMSDF
ncbi:ankyrin repeat-containing domain protein [Coprinopsis sp. MPI-PUGE-AT-0042]|nr:ankyrin repeat-containing domain protein [Coprinopsis sp. MPI-PUGE-AT-0042]